MIKHCRELPRIRQTRQKLAAHSGGVLSFFLPPLHMTNFS
jgi:hypothetical protein